MSLIQWTRKKNLCNTDFDRSGTLSSTPAGTMTGRDANEWGHTGVSRIPGTLG